MHSLKGEVISVYTIKSNFDGMKKTSSRIITIECDPIEMHTFVTEDTDKNSCRGKSGIMSFYESLILIERTHPAWYQR